MNEEKKNNKILKTENNIPESEIQDKMVKIETNNAILYIKGSGI